MDLKNHCLFCLERIAPYSISSKSEPSELGERTETETDFQRLCKYLGISLPEGEGKGGNDFNFCELELVCDTFLCICCYEMVDELRRLWRELEEMRRRIREVIVSHDVSENLDGEGRKRREEFEDKVLEDGEGRRSNECLQFVEMFQTLVKQQHCNELVLSDNPIRKRLRPGARKMAKAAPGLSTQPQLEPDVENAKDALIGVKVEVTEEEMTMNEEENEQFLDALQNTASSDPEGDDRTSVEVPKTNSSKEKNLGKDDDWKPANTRKRPSSRRKKHSSKSKKRTIKKASSSTSTSKSSRSKDRPLKFKCPDCDLSFVSYYMRWVHRSKYHPLKPTTTSTDSLSIPTLTLSKPPGVRNRIRIKICTICNAQVKEYSGKLLNYMEHMLSHEEDSAPPDRPLHSCPHCDKSFLLKINLDLHKTCIHETRQLVIRCDYCSEYTTFKTREELILHLKSLHSSNVFSCKHCPMSYITPEKLLLHMGKDAGSKRLLCPECDLGVLSTMRELRKHCHNCHPHFSKTYGCSFCDKYFLLPGSLQRHMETNHNYDSTLKTVIDPILFTCKQCNNGKVYKSKVTLDQHVKFSHSSSGRKLKCDQCEETFVYRSNLREHVQKSHEKIRYPCPHCPKSYGDQKQLDFHLKTHTGEGLFTCQFCSKQFPRIQQLNVHLRTHDKLGPDDKRVCDVCGKEFLGEHRLLKHKKDTHSEKRHECSVCGIKMKRLDHLRNHMRTHSGERPYSCPVCGKGFNRRDILRVHVKGDHSMELSELEGKGEDGS